MKSRQLFITTGLFAAGLLAAACGGGDRNAENESAEGRAASGAESGGTGGGAAGAGFSTTQLTPESGRRVITVQMETDAQGNNKFDPSDFEVHRGDVIRYTLKSGVHNVHFVADSNKSLTGYPAQPSDMLQLPGQTLDVKVDWPEGSYYYQCDPHALLGMVGRVKVDD